MLRARRGLHPRAGPDRAGRRGDRASSPAAPTRPASGTRSASSATASPPCTSPTACAAPSRTRTRASAARRSAPRSCACVSETQSPSEAELREPALLGRRPTGCAPPATPPPTRSSPSCSGSSPRARRSGSRRGARTAIVRPLLGVWREETRAYCDERGLPYREDTSNAGTKRGLIRNEILPLLEQLDPRARSSLLSLADERPRLPRSLERTLAELLASRDGTRSADLGGGVRAVREYGTLRLEGSVSGGRGRSRPSGRGSRSGHAGRGIASQAAGRKCRICSWTRRCRGRSATRGRSSSAATRSSPCRVSPRRRGGKER